jgi:hypothetical protein
MISTWEEKSTDFAASIPMLKDDCDLCTRVEMNCRQSFFG